jgi:hypothetical protein
VGILLMAIDVKGKLCIDCRVPLSIDNVAKKDNGEVLEYNRKSLYCKRCELMKKKAGA